MKYKIPPIKEAIFDIRIDKISKSSLEDLEKVHSLISKEYPNKKKQINLIGKIEFKEGAQVSNETGSEVRGFIFSNSSESVQVQYRLDGFTFNMLKPYSEWSKFSMEALRLWKIYSDNFIPNEVVRIALRYINRIEIPLPMGEFQDYISNMPPIPLCLPQTFHNFFMQVNVPCDNAGTGIIITETIEQAGKDKLPFILDIDAYKFMLKSKNIGYLKSEFNKLRDLKNKTFENCITEKSRKLFE
jgi:uncharacterized protein (TIGR04255 family)